MDQNHEARVRQRAYDLWLGENMPDGRSEAHWQQAEAELAQESDSPDLTAETSLPGSVSSAARKSRKRDAPDALLQASASRNGKRAAGLGRKASAQDFA